MKTSVSLVCALMVGFGLAACDKKEAPAPEATAAPSAVAPPTPAAPPPPAAKLDVDSIPVEEQYESDVEKEVTPANFEQKLDALDKELAAER